MSYKGLTVENIDMFRFSQTYGHIYTALYANDGIIDYSKAVDVAEYLVRNNAGYKRLLRRFYEQGHDVPTSDRELAAFVMAVRETGVLEGSCE